MDDEYWIPGREEEIKMRDPFLRLRMDYAELEAENKRLRRLLLDANWKLAKELGDEEI